MRRLVLGLGVVAMAVTCRTAPSPPPAAAARAAGEISPARAEGHVAAVQVIHRAARTPSGSIQPAALGRLADRAILTAAPGRLPFDAWAELSASGEGLVLVAVPRVGALAGELARRWKAASPGREVRVVDAGGTTSRPVGAEALVLVVAPDWDGKEVVPDPSAVAADLARAGWPAPRLVVVDLLEPTVGPGGWAADMMVAGTDTARVALATDYILRARAEGKVPDLPELARRRGLPEGELGWSVESLVD